MAADLTPGWTRYWCLRCKRALTADGKRVDTVTPTPDGTEPWKHDRCGGAVMLSSREVAA